MIRHSVTMVLMAAAWLAPGAAAGAAVASGAGPLTAAGSWRNAIEVPGLRTLNSGGTAAVSSVSCGSAGNCAAGGYYTDVALNEQVFVVTEKNGRWGRAAEVRGSGALNAGGHARLLSVSCGSAGNCAAGGYYWDSSRDAHAFVVAEQSGRWGRAVEVPGLAALNMGKGAAVFSVSCPRAGKCVAGGQYTDDSVNGHAFVATEQNGRWGKAAEVPGSSALNAGGAAAVFSVSCPSAGECAAGGYYTDGSGHGQGFLASQS